MIASLRPAGAYSIGTILEFPVVTVAGMTPKTAGRLVRTGRLGHEIDLETGFELAAIAARRAVEAATSTAADAGLTLESSAHVVVYVAVAGEFAAISEVADGASSIFMESLGGLPSRVAVGVPRLPGNAPVEIALTVSTGRGSTDSRGALRS